MQSFARRCKVLQAGDLVIDQRGRELAAALLCRRFDVGFVERDPEDAGALARLDHVAGYRRERAHAKPANEIG